MATTKEVLQGLLEDALKGIAERVVLVPLPGGAPGWGTPALISASKKSGRKVEELFDEVREKLPSHPLIDEVRLERNYLNVYFDPSQAAKHALKNVLSGEIFHFPKKTERIMVEYSQPNTHKEFHLGHLRNLYIGDVLVRLLRFYGYEVISANYIGDWGNHVAKALYLLRKRQPLPDLKTPLEKGKFLGKIYAESSRIVSEFEKLKEAAVERLVERLGTERLCRLFSVEEERLVQFLRLQHLSKLLALAESEGVELPEEVVSSPLAKERVDEEIAEIFKEWENPESEVRRLWEVTKEWSLEYFRWIYAQERVEFDVWFYESEVEEGGKEFVMDLLRKGIAKRNEGAVIVDFAEHGREDLGVMVLLRRDGSTLYQTKDLHLARLKFEKYGVDRSIYVVATPQSFYFKQLFYILKLAGFKAADKCYHLGYDVVSFGGKMLASRSGEVVTYTEFMEKLMEAAREKIVEKGEGDERIAEAVARSAARFGFLNREHSKRFEFNLERELNFEGKTGPYLLYGCVRAKKILSKAGSYSLPEEVSPGEKEVRLALQLEEFRDAVAKSAEKYSQTHLLSYLYNLTRTFNEFYHECPVLSAKDETTRNFRLALVEGYLRVMEKGLWIMNVDVPERM